MEVAVMGQGKSIRLDRFLAEMKQGTRSQVKEMIRKGRVLVDGTVCRESDRKIFPDETRVTLDGQPVGWADTEYYMLNKPQGVVSATEDGRYQTVIDLIDEAKRKDLFPVGRLDIDTEGLLLITNDGALAHELLAPKKHVDKFFLLPSRQLYGKPDKLHKIYVRLSCCPHYPHFVPSFVDKFCTPIFSLF